MKHRAGQQMLIASVWMVETQSDLGVFGHAKNQHRFQALLHQGAKLGLQMVDAKAEKGKEIEKGQSRILLKAFRSCTWTK